ncbi:MAG: hypothetical protein HYZ53_20280 [Planctomycetes bacterium]|nr:hypothetical protein [Planctomycetota bacterium]
MTTTTPTPMTTTKTIQMRLRTHEGPFPIVPIAWVKAPIPQTCHGFFVPQRDATRLATLLAEVPASAQAELRILREAAGWFFLLFRGEMPAIGPFPLRRQFSGPWLFAPASLVPTPPPTEASLEPLDAGAGGVIVGRVADGQLEWIQAERLSLADLVTLIGGAPPERALHPAPGRHALPAPLVEAPRFARSPLPASASWQEEAGQALGSPAPADEGVLARILGGARALPRREDWAEARAERRAPFARRAGRLIGRAALACLQALVRLGRSLWPASRPTRKPPERATDARPPEGSPTATGTWLGGLLLLAVAAVLLARLPWWLSMPLLLFLLARLCAAGKDAPTRGGAGSSARPGGAGAPGGGRSSGALGRWFSGLRGRAASLAGGMLAEVFDRQAAMLDRLIGAFDRNELDLALRHAVPMDDALVDGLRDGQRLSLSWRLPENLVDFSLAKLQETPGAVLGPGLERRIYALVAQYHRAAEEMLRRSEPRKAAFIYAHLLRDYERAAQVLARHGFAREAAALYLDRLHNRREAAEVLLRGGHVDEAAGLYLDEKDYGSAASIYERAGFAEEARACYREWAEGLAGQGRRVQAGLLLWRRLGDLEGAAALFREEFERGPATTRGQVAAHVVLLGHELGHETTREYGEYLGSMRVRSASSRSGDDALALVEFHRLIREWRPGRALEEGAARGMRREARTDLYRIVDPGTGLGDADVRREALGQLRATLAADGDELAARDLEKGLALRERGTPEKEEKAEAVAATPGSEAGANAPVVAAVAAPMLVLVAKGRDLLGVELSGKLRAWTFDEEIRAVAGQWEARAAALVTAGGDLVWADLPDAGGAAVSLGRWSPGTRFTCVGASTQRPWFVAGAEDGGVWLLSGADELGRLEPNATPADGGSSLTGAGSAAAEGESAGGEAEERAGRTALTCCADVRGMHLLGGEGERLLLLLGPTAPGAKHVLAPLQPVQGAVRYLASNRRELVLVARRLPRLDLVDLSRGPVVRRVAGVPVDGLSAGGILGVESSGAVRLVLGYDSGDVLLVRIDLDGSVSGQDRIRNPELGSIAAIAVWPGTGHCLAVSPALRYVVIGDDPAGPTVRRGRVKA